MKNHFSSHPRLYDKLLTSSLGMTYFRNKKENLPLPIQMQLSQKQETWAFFIKLFKCTLNFEDLKKNEPCTFCIF